MKSFTKFYAMFLALLISFSVMAQMTTEEVMHLRALDQQELRAHGPSLDVPYEPNNIQATGDDCSDPIIITVSPGMGTWSDYSQTTCGRVDDYDAAYGTCVSPSYYTNGEDLVYELVVTADMWIEVNFDPVQTYGSINVMQGCPDVGAGNTCLYGSNTSSSALRTFQWEFAAGTYYIQIDSWPSPDCIDFDLWIDEYIPPAPADPITSFPYTETFEATCDWPATMQSFAGSEAHAVVSSQAGFESSCGAMLDGNSYSGFYHTSNCESSFTNNYPDHTAQIKMSYTPDGTPGVLQLDFDFFMSYSFSDYYSGFRVTVDGNQITEKNLGESCIKGDIDWTQFIFELGAYQVTGQNYELIIDFIGKYYVDYYNGGDVAKIDNVHIWYVPAGDIQGYAYNMGVAEPGVEIGFLGDAPPYPAVMTDGVGYYRFTNVPTEPINPWPMYAYKDGLNYVEADVMYTTGVMIDYDWNISSPLMVITPALLEETMNPNEWRSVPITITNGPTGGPLHWTAEIIFGEPPTMASSHSVPAFEGKIPESLAPEHNALAPEGYGEPGHGINAGSRGVMAFGYEAVGSGSYDFDVDNLPGKTQVGGAAPGGDFFGGMVFDMDDENICYGITFYGSTLYSIDRTTGAATAIGGTPGISQCAGMAVDLTEGVYYATAGDQLWIVDVETGATTNVGSHGTSLMIGFSGDGEGNLWGFDMSADQFYSIDKTTGAATAIGSIGFNAGYAQSMFYDQVDDRVIMAAFNVSNFYAEIRHVDVTTGGSTILSSEYFVEMTGSAAPAGASGGGWLDLSAYEGDVASGESDFVNALFDATGTVPGQVWTADILFTAQPGISTATVDVSMIIAGEPLVPVDELEAELVNMVTGQVDLSWSFASNDITFEYFLVRRDGAPVANTQNYSYTDYLPDYGEYCFTVSAVYTEGESVPAGPECVIWLIPELCYSPDPVYGEVWTGDSEVFQITLENCGEGVLAFEFTDFDDPDFSNGFVTAVEPYIGQILEGETMNVNITFDATSYGAGTHLINLDLATNELAPDNERLIACEMFAYTPATLYGTVTDCDNGLPLANVTVVANGTLQFTGETDATGYYEFYVDEDTYDVSFTKLAYTDFQVTGVFAPQGVMTEVNGSLCEYPYPVQWVVLDPNEADTQALITWSLPMGPYEIIYDDGSAENYFAWIQWGGATAVKFTPAGYPASVAGGRIFVGDGSYPEGASFIGAPMSVGVLDDDGPNGMPGTILDSVAITCDNYGWVNFGLSGATFNDGNFYLVYWQVTVPPFSPPVGIDEENPVMFRSYTKQVSGEWQTSSYNDFMMRATVFGPGDNVMAAMMEGERVTPPKPADLAHIAMKAPTGASGTIKGGEFMPVAGQSADRDLEKYRIAYVDGFDPDLGETPLDGTLTPFGTTTNNYRTHNGWGGFAPGFYAYAVRAEYASSQSEWAYSNIAAHLLDREVTVNVVQCDGEEPSGALVTMLGHNYPYQMLAMVTPASGTVVFDSVIMGIYDLAVNKLGYQSWEWPNMVVSDDMVVDVTLQETEYPARNLYVDPLTSVATWDEPLYIQVPQQGFEEAPFPPAGWQIITPGIGWERTQDGSSSYWTVPATPSGDWYAVANDDQYSGNTQDDYLITPMVDLREATDYELNSLWYYDGAWGQPQPEIVYSTDAGATWETLYTVGVNFSWQNVDIDLSFMSGPDGLSSVWFAMYVYDQGWNSGAAVDDIYIGNGPVDVMGYHVFLDDGFVAETVLRTYRYKNLQYGTTYTAAVAALYACNISEKIYYTFTSDYLYPPRDLTDEYLYNTNEVPLYFLPPMTEAGPGAPTFNPLTYTPATSSSFALDADPNGQVREVNFNRDVWDILYGFEMDGPSGLVSLAGAESDGEFVYAPVWNSGDIVKFLPDGTYVETFQIPGASGIRDMAFDGVYMYGAAASTTVWIMDFTNQTMEGSIAAPTACRALAYDEETETFWGNNWDSPFTNFDYDGTLLGSITVPSIYGAAFDNYNDDGPYIWVHSGTSSGGGCQVEQMDITGVMTGEAHSVSGDFGSDGIAGGLYMDGNIVPGLMVLGGTMQGSGDVAFGYEMGPYSGGGPGGGEIPDGLVSFNVYRDMALIGSAPYNDEDVDEFIQYVDNPVDPGCYEYTVTAVYDLSVYGFPGQTGESFHEGPDTVCVVWGYDLPFMETWDEGNLEFNNWRLQPGVNNWIVSSANGNPDPSAQFNWDPDPGADYAVTLESAPLNADMLTEGDIWMDFEYFLDNRNATGMEKLAVEVYNGQEWMQVAEYTNAASMDWTFQHLQITGYAMGRVFQVRFNAKGMNSFDVVRWNVDNIHVYRTCEAPSDLDGEYLWNDVDDLGANIWWEAPELPAPPEGWLLYHDGTIEYVWGSDSGDWESDVAMYFEPSQLEDYPDCAVTNMKLFVDSRGANGGYVIAKVWEGPEAATLLYEEDVSAQMLWNDDINEVTLSQAVPFDNTKELWLGFTTGGPSGVFIAGITMELPAAEHRGDLYRDEGGPWQHISDLGIGERVWILEAYVTQDYAPTSAPVPLVDNREFVGHGSPNLANGGATITVNSDASRDFGGFNIYRMGPDEMEYTMIDNVPYVAGQTSYTYFDADPYEGYPYEVCYQVTAVWESDVDYCESAPAASVIPIWDYVCITITSVDNPLAGDMTVLYPNPATDRVNISSSQQMDRITVVNYVGQVVFDSEMNKEQSFVLNTSSYDAGVYIVKISTATAVVTKRMTITK